MADIEKDKISIHEVNKPEAEELVRCYFKPKSNGT